MATAFRNAVVALERAKLDPTPGNIDRALYWTRAEYSRGGSVRSHELMREAEALCSALLRGAA